MLAELLKVYTSNMKTRNFLPKGCFLHGSHYIIVPHHSIAASQEEGDEAPDRRQETR